MNTFGNLFRITTAGESHGPANTVIIDNCPPNIELSEADIQAELDRRRPGQSAMTTPRKESDKCEITAGVFEGRTTGTSISVIVRNENQHSADYDDIKDVYRPSHADFTYEKKYGIRDYRGGGRASARETISRVIGGAVAKKVLKVMYNVEIWGFVDQIGTERFDQIDRSQVEQNPLRMADASAADRMVEMIKDLKREGDSIGGVVQIRIENPPIGLGSPVFEKLEADLGKAMLSVPAVKGFEIGEGFSLAEKKGSEANDPFVATLCHPELDSGSESVAFRTERNANGGVLGGISTGEDIWFRVPIKATSSISKPQKTANKAGENVDIQIKGRHDPILVPRAVPILESMAALVILDHIMLHKAQCQ